MEDGPIIPNAENTSQELLDWAKGSGQVYDQAGKISKRILKAIEEKPKA